MLLIVVLSALMDSEIEDLDWGIELLTSIIISDLTEGVELVCENLVTWEVSWLACVLVVQF